MYDDDDDIVMLAWPDFRKLRDIHKLVNTYCTLYTFFKARIAWGGAKIAYSVDFFSDKQKIQRIHTILLHSISHI